MLFKEGGFISQEEDGGVLESQPPLETDDSLSGPNQDDQSYLLVYSLMLVLIQQILYPFYTDLFTTHMQNYCIRYIGNLVLVALEAQARSF